MIKKIFSITLMLFSSASFATDFAEVENTYRSWRHADDYLNIEYADKKSTLVGQNLERFKSQQKAWLEKRIELYGTPSGDDMEFSNHINAKNATVGRLLDIKNDRNNVEAFDFDPIPDGATVIDEGRARSEWKRADRLLNIDYKVLLDQHSGDARQKLKDNQKSWLASVHASYGDPEVAEAGENQAEKFRNLEEVTLSRLLYLKAYTGDRVVVGLAGSYTDSLGGWINLGKNDDGTWFATIEVARGRTGANGFEEATLVIAPSKEGNASESGTLRLESGCTLSFKRVNHSIVITEGENSGCNHGLGASYTGVYLKNQFKALE